jgi:hypothetical protein
MSVPAPDEGRMEDTVSKSPLHQWHKLGQHWVDTYSRVNGSHNSWLAALSTSGDENYGQ